MKFLMRKITTVALSAALLIGLTPAAGLESIDNAIDWGTSIVANAADEELIAENTVTTSGWSTAELASVDFTGYGSARIELTATSNFNNFILNYGGTDYSYYIGASSVTAKLDGSTLAYNTLPKVSALQNKTTTIKVEGDSNTYTLKVYASTSGATSDSSSTEETGTPELLKTSYTLDGHIGMNLDYWVPSGYVSDKYTVKAVFENDGSTKEISLDKSKTVRVSGKKAYRFTLPVEAFNMTEAYTATLVVTDASGNEVAESESSTVKIGSCFRTISAGSDTALKSLATALQTYGYYLQKQFNSDATAPTSSPNDISDVTVDTVAQYAQTKEKLDSDTKISIAGTTMVVNAGTTIRIYSNNLKSYSADSLKLRYSADGATWEESSLSYSSSMSMYYGEIPNIGASKLSNMYTAYFVNGDTQVSDKITYGAYSYIYAILNGSYNENTQNIVKALYKYSAAANEYINSQEDPFDNLDTTVTASTKDNFGDYESTISNVDINGDQLYSQDSLELEFSDYGNLYDKSLYDNDAGSDVGIAFCGWNTYNYLQDPSLDYKLSYFDDGSEYGVKRMTFIPTYFIDTYEEGIKVDGSDTLDTDTQAEIMAEAIQRNVRLNYRLHIDPQRFAPNGGNYSSVDTSVPGSQWWRGEFTDIHPMGDDYLAMIDEGFEALEKTLAITGTDCLVEPIRFDIGAELMTSMKLYTSEWIELLEYCKEKRDASALLRDNVLISYNFCHHIEYLIEIEDHADYFSRINGTGVTYEDRQDLLFVDDMTEENRAYLAEFIVGLDTMTISQYMPMDIFEEASLTSTDVATTAEDVRDALLTHEQNFLQKVLIGKLGIDPEDIPPFHLGEYGMGIKGLTAPNVWDRTAWTEEELATYEVQQVHAQIALEGLMLYMQDERSVAKSLTLWISGAPYDVINFYPGMNVGDSGHGYPGQAAYNEEAAAILKKYWHGEF